MGRRSRGLKLSTVPIFANFNSSTKSTAEDEGIFAMNNLSHHVRWKCYQQATRFPQRIALLCFFFTEFYVTSNRIDNSFNDAHVRILFYSSSRALDIYLFCSFLCICHIHSFSSPSIFKYVTTPSHREQISSIIETSASLLFGFTIYTLDARR